MIARRLATLACCVVVTLTFAACKEGDTLPSAFQPTTAAFIGDDPSGMTVDYVTLEQVAVNQSRVTLAVVVHDVSEPVSGLALKLTYPNSFAKFVECVDGDLLPSGPCYFAEPDDDGVVFVGRSVSGTGQAVTASGARTIVNLEFLVFSQGAGALVIEGQNLGGSDASALLDENGDPLFVRWFSGALVGQ